MKTNALTYDDAHRFVDSFPLARWEGWTIKIFTASTSAETSSQGVRYNGQWGFEKAIIFNDSGEWLVPSRYLKYV